MTTMSTASTGARRISSTAAPTRSTTSLSSRLGLFVGAGRSSRARIPPVVASSKRPSATSRRPADTNIPVPVSWSRPLRRCRARWSSSGPGITTTASGAWAKTASATNSRPRHTGSSSIVFDRSSVPELRQTATGSNLVVPAAAARRSSLSRSSTPRWSPASTIREAPPAVSADPRSRRNVIEVSGRRSASARPARVVVVEVPRTAGVTAEATQNASPSPAADRTRARTRTTCTAPGTTR